MEKNHEKKPDQPLFEIWQRKMGEKGYQNKNKIPGGKETEHTAPPLPLPYPPQ